MQNEDHYKFNYEMSQRDNEILKLVLKFPKITNKDIAEAIGMSAQYVSNCRAKPVFIRAYDEQVKGLGEVLSDGQRMAVAVCMKYMQDPDPRVALVAAKILLAVNHGPAMQTNIQNLNYTHSVRFGSSGEIIKETQVNDVAEGDVIDVEPRNSIAGPSQ